MNDACMQSVTFKEEVTTGKVFAHAVVCNKLTCDTCRPKIIENLSVKILDAINRHNLAEFFTLTTVDDYDGLVSNFKALRKYEHSMKKENFMQKCRSKDVSEAELKYQRKMDEIVDYEILMMFYLTYVTDIAISIARKEGVCNGIVLL